jgi:hypothetical protein
MILWEGMTVRGAMAGLDDVQLRHSGGEQLGRLVQLFIEP